jgi:Zn-dependent protease
VTHVSFPHGSPALRCDGCGTELPRDAVVCPACHALVHAATLKSLAADAELMAREGKLTEAREHWEQALELLPAGTRQHEVITARVADLSQRIAESAVVKPKIDPTHSWWKRGAGVGIAVGLLLIGKGKFILLGLAKAKTLFSMVAFFGVYWTTFGWPLALGLVLSIYIHEMGHVAELKRLGIEAGAPLFIPGIGALVLLKKHIDDPVTDARVGLAGPIWGLAAGVLAYAVYLLTDAPIWQAIAQLTGFINLFNLIPIWQLDGSRGFHALSAMQRWIAVVVIAAAFALTGQKLLILLGGVAVFRCLRPSSAAGQGHLRTLATYSALVVSLSLMARAVG